MLAQSFTSGFIAGCLIGWTHDCSLDGRVPETIDVILSDDVESRHWMWKAEDAEMWKIGLCYAVFIAMREQIITMNYVPMSDNGLKTVMRRSVVAKRRDALFRTRMVGLHTIDHYAYAMTEHILGLLGARPRVGGTMIPDTDCGIPKSREEYMRIRME